jgi:TatD DNase family protein
VSPRTFDGAGLIDTHCHLAHIDRPGAEVLDEATAAGIEAVVDIGMGLTESQSAADRARDDARVFAAVGIHPNDTSEFESDPAATMSKLRDIATSPRVVGIGETGLDFYRDRSSRESQEGSFRAHIALAKEADRSLVIHCRDAHEHVLRVLDEEGSPERVIMHCFSGDAAFARACNDRSYFCSFAGNLTYKRNDDLREAARAVADELLLVETDAPFLAPEPFRGKPNAPALVVHTAAFLADVRSTSVNALTSLLRENATRAFVIP